MKVLFITTFDVNLKNNGGELCTNRNYLSFCDIVGEENVTVVKLLENLQFSLSNAIQKRINFFRGLHEGLTKQKVTELVKKANDFDIVFINTSTYGALAKHLRKSGYQGKIISFFHNVEVKIKQERIKQEPFRLLEVLVVRHNEAMACKYSNSIIALNKRDADELKRIYKAQNINIIPISLIDSYLSTSVENTNIPPTFIFTGNNWYANIHGITWFIDNVLEHVEIKLQITGRRMDELKDKFEHPKIEFLGFVDDLPAVLKAADYVLLPIFMGSGMKVKTCEALMYGKHIIGTTESFEGYNIEHSKVGALCNTKDEFIEAINQLCSVERNKFNKESRSYYDNYFSFDATLEKFKELI